MDHYLGTLIATADAYFVARGMDPTNAQQVDCLTDPTREDEALEMVDDWGARLGLPSDIRADLSAWIVDRHYINARG